MYPEAPRREPAFIVLTCEHAGNVVPQEYQQLFQAQAEVLQTHRGYDAGALEVALELADQLAAPLQFTATTRLLVDTNRSPENDQLFSEFTHSLSEAQKTKVLDDYYWPHRSAIEKMITALTQAGQRVLHIAVHSFIDALEDQPRDFEIGLLFDPHRASEAELAAHWFAALELHLPHLRCVRNQPYRGTDDGLTTFLRTVFDANLSSGFAVELRLGILMTPEARARAACVLASTLKLLNQRPGSLPLPARRPDGIA